MNYSKKSILVLFLVLCGTLPALSNPNRILQVPNPNNYGCNYQAQGKKFQVSRLSYSIFSIEYKTQQELDEAMNVCQLAFHELNNNPNLGIYIDTETGFVSASQTPPVEGTSGHREYLINTKGYSCLGSETQFKLAFQSFTLFKIENMTKKEAHDAVNSCKVAVAAARADATLGVYINSQTGMMLNKPLDINQEQNSDSEAAKP